jgi:hypothetical protein
MTAHQTTSSTRMILKAGSTRAGSTRSMFPNGPVCMSENELFSEIAFIDGVLA